MYTFAQRLLEKLSRLPFQCTFKALDWKYCMYDYNFFFFYQSRLRWIPVWRERRHHCSFVNQFVWVCMQRSAHTHTVSSCWSTVFFLCVQVEFQRLEFWQWFHHFFRVALNVWQKITYKTVTTDAHRVVPSVTLRRILVKTQNLCGLKCYFPFLSAGSYVFNCFFP